MRVKFKKTEVSRAGKRYETRRIPLTGGMKVGTVQYCVVDRTCHELFDTEWITKVHGKWSQRSACSRQVSSTRIDCTSGTRTTLAYPFSIGHRETKVAIWREPKELNNVREQFTRVERAVSRLWPVDKEIYFCDIIMFRSNNYSCHSTNDKNSLRITS